MKSTLNGEEPENCRHKGKEIRRFYISKAELDPVESKYLHVNIKGKEVGHNHWIMIYFLALHPTEGLTIRIRCFEDVTIQDYKIFVYNQNFQLDPEIPKGTKDLKISCQEWIDEGAGGVVVVSMPECDENAA